MIDRVWSKRTWFKGCDLAGPSQGEVRVSWIAVDLSRLGARRRLGHSGRVVGTTAHVGETGDLLDNHGDAISRELPIEMARVSREKEETVRGLTRARKVRGGRMPHLGIGCADAVTHCIVGAVARPVGSK